MGASTREDDVNSLAFWGNANRNANKINNSNQVLDDNRRHQNHSSPLSLLVAPCSSFLVRWNLGHPRQTAFDASLESVHVFVRHQQILDHRHRQTLQWKCVWVWTFLEAPPLINIKNTI